MKYNFKSGGVLDTVRELLTYVPATVKSDPPSGVGLVEELGAESGMTPLHLASYSGNENVVRLLLNSFFFFIKSFFSVFR